MTLIKKYQKHLITLIIALGLAVPGLATHTAGTDEPYYRYQDAECDEIVLRYHWLRPLPGYGASAEEPQVTTPGLLLGLGMIITAPLMLLRGAETDAEPPDQLEELTHAGRMKNCPEIIEQINRDLREDNPEIFPELSQ